jgi:hypothetical protein
MNNDNNETNKQCNGVLIQKYSEMTPETPLFIFQSYRPTLKRVYIKTVVNMKMLLTSIKSHLHD